MAVRVSIYVWALESGTDPETGNPRKLTPTQKLVAAALADNCQDDGSEARPSKATLVRKTGLSERAVQTALKNLVDLGVIRIDRPSGQHRPNCYRFPIPEWFATLRPEGQMKPQGSSTRRPGEHQMPPNYQERSIEQGTPSVSESEEESMALVRRYKESGIAP